MVERSGPRIRSMFEAIAPTYDLLNHLLSLSIDRYWRRVTRRSLEVRLGPCDRVLDLCTGTGDLAIEMAKIAPVIACDFAHPMLTRAVKKAQRRCPANRVLFVEGDALALPFPADSFQAATIAFGLRNLEDYGVGLSEAARVVREGGYLAVLEFAVPASPLLGTIYRIYFERLLPLLGGLVSGDIDSYRYLPESVKGFPRGSELEDLFVAAGFSTPHALRLSGGIVEVHIAHKKVAGYADSRLH